LAHDKITRIAPNRLAGLWTNLPGYDLLERFIDVFATRQRLRLVVTSDNYCEVRIAWGLFEFAKGSKQEFLIEGGPGFCEAVLRSLEGSKRTVKVVSRVVGNRELLN
jgi:hypothetical protein